MLTQRFQLYIERRDTEKNMARFYAMAIEPNLFGEICLTRRWGRIGTTGQMMIHHFTREEEAVVLFLDLVRRKRARGYRPKAPERGHTRLRETDVTRKQ
ncbi:WGR domain-containing protein [Rhizobium sp. SL42]|uniref:WGR domain-containing protein n=1 Tax=Rhizobium sp. SL42 TaxID=2806346 RepID=UPI001F16FAB2|nr:WGR domain-containing protein [Rhizobium sp. SL42]UJW77804.1 WGR domain-containing protein [Rhizobium sp. SL42]